MVSREGGFGATFQVHPHSLSFHLHPHANICVGFVFFKDKKPYLDSINFAPPFFICIHPWSNKHLFFIWNSFLNYQANSIFLPHGTHYEQLCGVKEGNIEKKEIFHYYMRSLWWGGQHCRKEGKTPILLYDAIFMTWNAKNVSFLVRNIMVIEKLQRVKICCLFV